MSALVSALVLQNVQPKGETRTAELYGFAGAYGWTFVSLQIPRKNSSCPARQTENIF